MTKKKSALRPEEEETKARRYLRPGKGLFPYHLNRVGKKSGASALPAGKEKRGG